MYMYSWDTIIWYLNNLWYSSFLPSCQQGAFVFYVERTKKLWHDCSSSSSPSNRTWTKCESISLNYLPSGRNSGCHTSFLCRKVGRAKGSGKFWCETKIMCIGKNYSPTMASCGRLYNDLGGPSHDLELCTSWAWLASWEDLPFRLASWAFNDSNSFCRVWTWMAWVWSTFLLSTLCSFFLTFLLELPLVGKTWVEGWGALAFGWGVTKDVGRFCRGNRNCFHSGNLAKQIAFWCSSFPQ